jgi:hypothetical protein
MRIVGELAKKNEKKIIVCNLFHITPSSCQEISPVTAAALSTVLNTTMLSYICGNVRYSGACQTETPEPINMKFCTIDFVNKIT